MTDLLDLTEARRRNKQYMKELDALYLYYQKHGIAATAAKYISPEAGDVIGAISDKVLANQLLKYVIAGVKPGEVLQHVITNNVLWAFSTHQPLARDLPNVLRFLVNHSPSGCYGFRSSVDEWNRQGGMLRDIAEKADGTDSFPS